MTTATHPTAEGIAGPNRAPAELLTVRDAAAMLAVSPRHIYRQCDAGRMPRPLKLGSSIRWRRSEVLAWIAQGCPSVRTTKGASK